MCMYKDGVRIRKKTKKPREIKKPEDMKPRVFYITKKHRYKLYGSYVCVKDYMRTILSEQQGDAFDVDAFHTTFDSDDWKSLCASLPFMQKLI